MKKMQGYMSNGLLLNYMLVMLSFSIGVSYLATEGCVASMMLAKFIAGSLIVGLWYLMAHNFLVHKKTFSSVFLVLAVTFFASINVILLVSMDSLQFTIAFEDLIAAGAASVGVVLLLTASDKLTALARDYHDKHNHHGPHAS